MGWNVYETTDCLRFDFCMHRIEIGKRRFCANCKKIVLLSFFEMETMSWRHQGNPKRELGILVEESWSATKMISAARQHVFHVCLSKVLHGSSAIAVRLSCAVGLPATFVPVFGFVC